MLYRCPVCGFTADSDAILARHMATTTTLYENHLEWMDAQGIDWTVYSPHEELEQQEALFDDLLKVIDSQCRSGD